MRWLLGVVFGVVVLGAVGMTALEKYDESSCRDDPRLVREAVTHTEVKPRDLGDGRQTLGVTLIVIDSPAEYETCDGFLPW